MTQVTIHYSFKGSKYISSENNTMGVLQLTTFNFAVFISKFWCILYQNFEEVRIDQRNKCNKNTFRSASQKSMFEDHSTAEKPSRSVSPQPRIIRTKPSVVEEQMFPPPRKLVFNNKGIYQT